MKENTNFLKALNDLFRIHGENIPIEYRPVVVYIAGGSAIHYWTRTNVTQDVDCEFGSRILLEDLSLTYMDEAGDERSIYIDKNYKDLTYFDIRAVTFVDSKITEQASKYIQDHKYGDTGNLHLELKSFIFDHPFDNTLYTEFEVPVYYSNEVVEKWVEYECGNGLWYFFEYKRGLYEKALRVDTVYDGDQKEIKEICLRIDKERYMDLDFGPELLSKLGNQFYQEIIPKLYRIQIYLDKGLPRIVKYLFILLGILIVFGVALPLLIKLFSLNSVFDVISTSMILSLCFYLISSFYQSMHNEIKLY